MQDEKIMNKYKELTEKKSIGININKDKVPGILDNKLGGTPYLPVGINYPIDSNGNPMLLLLQVNLKDVNSENLPSSGILEIFITRTLDYPLEGKVFIFNDGLEYQKEFSNIDASDFIVGVPMAIECHEVIEYMPITNYESEEVLSAITSCGPCCAWSISDEFFENLYNEVIKDSPKASLCGYPDFIQDDPREEGDNREICLFKLDSSLDDNIYIGDCGILTITMSENDLKNCNFDNVVFDWDCY